MMSILLPALLAGLVAPALAQTPTPLILQDFETTSWPGVSRSTEQVKQGEFSGKWTDLKAHPRIRVPGVPTDWSPYDRLCFWLHSEKANGQRLTLCLDSDNPDDNEGWDYFFYHFRVDWTGWKRFDLLLGEDIRPSRKPLGWQQINYFSINAASWQNAPLPDTVLCFDDVKLASDRDSLRLQTRKIEGEGAQTYEAIITNPADRQQAFTLTQRPLNPGAPGPFDIAITGITPGSPQAIAPNDTRRAVITLSLTEDAGPAAEPLTRGGCIIEIASDEPDAPVRSATFVAAVPLPARAHPFLFGDAALYARAKARAEESEWAKGRLEGIIRTADSVLKAELDVPDESGQWSHHYVCKKCGARLKHQGDKHVCGKCGAEYAGWPYDQVIIAGIHHRNWRHVRDLGLAYALSGAEAYAEKAREILLAYADKYLGYPIHNSRGKVSRSGARVFAQTLDESVSIIGVAWGYDLIYNSPCLSAEDRERIAAEFLRPVVDTIRRNNAGISNWQSWHNAGMAAVGFCLQDEEIASLAINGRSGLRFQLGHSILPDGFWYEGTAAYHYYALAAIVWAAEAAHFAGISVYEDQAYKSLFDAPLLYVFPDLTFPAVNDSDVFSVAGRHGLYELAYARFGDPTHLSVATRGNRSSLEAFLWGVDELPPAPPAALASKDFKGLGAAVLRQDAGTDQLYVHLDYGPHGGGHGHPDKLALILFGLGHRLAPDAARLAYGAPLQGSWYRQTFAHNTICVDQTSQKSATGELTMFHSEPGLAIAQAECDAAYPGVMMRRTLALTGEYLIDVFDVAGDQRHIYDYAYHNFGALEPGPTAEPREEPLGATAGYQHMTGISETITGETWSADFKERGANVRLTMVGEGNTELFFGMGMADNPPKPCAMLVARREGESARFISIIEPYRKAPAILGVRCIPTEHEDALCLEMIREGGKDLLLLAERGGVEREFAGVTTTARACFVRMAGVETVAAYHIE